MPMSEHIMIPLIVLALTFPTLSLIPFFMHVLTALRNIDRRLAHLEGRHECPSSR